MHHHRILGKIERRITDKPPQCFVVSKGGERCCRHKTCDMFVCGQTMDDGANGAEACLDDIRADYDSAIAAGKAVGLGLGLKNSGLGKIHPAL